MVFRSASRASVVGRYRSLREFANTPDMVAEHGRPSAPWLAGLLLAAVPTALALRASEFELGATAPWLAVVLPGVACFVWSWYSSRRPGSTSRAAFAAGASAGILVG